MKQPSPRHSTQSRPGMPLQSGQGTMRPLPGGVMVAAMVVTSLGTGHLPECTTTLSGFSLSFGRALKNGVGGGDWWFGRLDHRISAPFGQDVPGLAEVHFAGFLRGDPHGPPLVDLGLAFA